MSSKLSILRIKACTATDKDLEALRVGIKCEADTYDMMKRVYTDLHKNGVPEAAFWGDKMRFSKARMTELLSYEKQLLTQLSQ